VTFLNGRDGDICNWWTQPDRIAELYRLADLSTVILDETAAFIHAMAYPAGFYNDPRMPLMYAIRAEGIDL
jgi:hypothetical protein